MDVIRAAMEHKNIVYQLLCELENGKPNLKLFEETYSNNLSDDSIYYLLAINENVAVGFASLHIQYLLHHVGKVGEFQEIIVSKNYRGKSIGEILFKNLRRIALENGCILMEVCCNQNRVQSHEFYLKQGMKNSHYKFTMSLS